MKQCFGTEVFAHSAACVHGIDMHIFDTKLGVKCVSMFIVSQVCMYAGCESLDMCSWLQLRESLICNSLRCLCILRGVFVHTTSLVCAVRWLVR